MKRSGKDDEATGAPTFQLVLRVIEMLCRSISPVTEPGLEYHALLEQAMVHAMHTFIQFRIVLVDTVSFWLPPLSVCRRTTREEDEREQQRRGSDRCFNPPT